eukprot:2378688-Prymnesium_polylepis.1
MKLSFGSQFIIENKSAKKFPARDVADRNRCVCVTGLRGRRTRTGHARAVHHTHPVRVRRPVDP